MFVPEVLTGVEEPHALTGARVQGFCLVALGNVAMGTSQTQVIGCRLAAGGGRRYVVDMERLTDQYLWRVAILAPLGGTGVHLRGQAGGNPCGQCLPFLGFGRVG